MEKNLSDRATTSKDAQVGTSQRSTLPTFTKIISSPSGLNKMASRIPSSPTSSSTTTPTLGQIGKQGSINFRHSQLYDSDADDQTFLLRTPSLRSHKFIIIPATSSVEKGKQISRPLSTTSLTSLQKLPLRSPTNQNLSEVTATTTAITTISAPLTASSKTNVNKFRLQPQSTTSTTSPTLLSRSDVIHHQLNMPESKKLKPTATTTTTTATTATIASSNVNTSVKFTIEDYESDNATDAITIATTTNATNATTAPTTMTTSSSSTLDAFYSPNMPAITSIYSASNNNSYTLPSQSTSRQLLLSSSSSASFSPSVLTLTKSQPSPSVRPVSALLASTSFNHNNFFNSSIDSANGALSLGVGLRPRYNRDSSMRSIVSAYLSDPNELTINSFIQHDGDSSSYLYRDSVANQIYSDVTSVRSLASIGIGSTDGRRLVIKRVPQTPTELLNIVNPPTPQLPGIEDDDDDSFMDETSKLKPRNQHWANKMQFVLACIGYSVGLGNVWRFPYMCYKSGGGVFLVPYLIILVVCSIPLLFMELSIGQYTGRGPIGALGQLCPLFKGAGLASVVVSFLMSTYYSVLIAYSIYYFFTAFKTSLPWIDCNNRWNTPDCWVTQRSTDNVTAPPSSRTPSEEFFQNKVLQISPGIEYPGNMRWDLFACLIFAWLMVYFATWKSIKSSAKARYFTATFPFVLIIILIFRAVTLEGANDGLNYFFRPNWSELKHANVWINAASQNFNSLGITFGSMISFASYNKYNNNILRDTVAVSVVNVMTSLLVGIFAFATLGNLALEQNTNIQDVISDGPGLIFVVYPQALAKMPYAQLWSVMFFFMLWCLGLNSQFAIVEVVVTSIQDGFPNWIKKYLGYHEIVVLIVCLVSFLFGLPNLIQGGIYFFQLMDHYAASVTIMFLAFSQMIAIAWFYGVGRLSKNVKQMTGKEPSLYLKSCWILCGPCLLFAIWILSLINYKEPTYHNGHYTYPDWAYGIGWMFALFSLICIPFYALVNLWKAQGNSLQERFKITLRPNIYECKICGEHHCEHDYPEQEQYMLSQELSGVYKATTPTHDQPQPMFPMNVGQKSGYNPLQIQESMLSKQENSYEKPSTSTEKQPATSATR